MNMKAFFIYRDGELFGSPIGYTTLKGAQKSLVGTEDWYRELYKYNHPNKKLKEDAIKLGIFEWHDGYGYMFKREVWSRKIWQKYVKKHYEIKEKEFEIVFKD